MTSSQLQAVERLRRKDSLQNTIGTDDSGTLKSSIRSTSDTREQSPQQKVNRRRANSLHAVGRTYIMEALSFFDGRERESARICLDQIILLRKADAITAVGASLIAVREST